MSARTTVEVNYIEDNAKELNDEKYLDLINLSTSLLYDEAVRCSKAKGAIGRGLSFKHTMLFTDDPGELIDEEVPKKESDGEEEWEHGIRALSPSIIHPGPRWWERGPEVVMFLPPSPEPDVTATVREKLGAEFPHALGKQVEELMAEHWEELRKEGHVGRVEESRPLFNSMLVDAQAGLANFSKALYKRRMSKWIQKTGHEFEFNERLMNEVKGSAREGLGHHYSDLEISSSDSSDQEVPREIKHNVSELEDDQGTSCDRRVGLREKMDEEAICSSDDTSRGPNTSSDEDLLLSRTPSGIRKQLKNLTGKGGRKRGAYQEESTSSKSLSRDVLEEEGPRSKRKRPCSDSEENQDGLIEGKPTRLAGRTNKIVTDKDDSSSCSSESSSTDTPAPRKKRLLTSSQRTLKRKSQSVPMKRACRKQVQRSTECSNTSSEFPSATPPKKPRTDRESEQESDRTGVDSVCATPTRQSLRLSQRTFTPNNL